MPNILILGAGVMGTALAFPASANGHIVHLAGTPKDVPVIERLKKLRIHPKLDRSLTENVVFLDDTEVTVEHANTADLIIVGVSSPGIPWAVRRLNELLNSKKPIAFVTKGLDRCDGRVVTYAETVPNLVPNMASFIAIGGPCIARELSNGLPTLSVYASRNIVAAKTAAAFLRNDYYRLTIADDVIGVEACAALKNFFAIGVSAMQTRHPDAWRVDGQSKNPVAGAFNQAVHEMASLCEHIGGVRATAFDLAGLGDLHVTVGGGRNSRLGHSLGQDKPLSQIMNCDLAGETVEGVDTAKFVQMLLHQIEDAAEKFPLATAIIDAVIGAGKLDFRYEDLFRW